MSNLKKILDHINNKNFSSALKLCEIFQNKKNEHVIFNLKGIIYISLNNFERAENNFLKSLSLNKTFIDPIKNLFILYSKKEEIDKTIIYAKKLIEIDSSNALFNFQLGAAYDRKGNFKKAIEFYKNCIKIDEKYKKIIFNNLGSMYAKKEKYKISNKYYFKALKFNDNDKIIVNNILSNYVDLRENEQIDLFLKKAELIDPNYFPYLHNKAQYFFNVGKIQDAIKILKINKNNPESLILLTKIYFKIGETKKGQFLISSSKNLFEKNSSGRNFYGTNMLYEGDFKNGFKYYEEREQKISGDLFRDTKEWNGENIEGKNIVVFNEQGLGDAIHFSKYILPLLKISNKITFIVKKNIAGIFKNNFQNLEITTIENIKNVKFDYKIALGSLLKFFYDKKIENISLIKDKSEAVPDLKSKILNNNKLNVGIVWSGSFFGPNEPYRSIPLKALDKIFSLEANFYSLQSEIWERDEEYFRNKKIINLGNYSLDKLSIIISDLDLVISSDTIFLHLSSSLNKETWGIINLYPDWRWGEFNKINPYKTLKLFRQKEFNKWDGVVLEIFENLKKKVLEKQK